VSELVGVPLDGSGDGVVLCGFLNGGRERKDTVELFASK
jgi:hypothetical protein